MEKTIVITEADRTRLQKLIVDAQEYNLSKKDNLKKLGEELKRAQIVTSENIPPDVITMNSQVKLKDLETGEEMICTLVFPDQADVAENKISVLAPIGTAILGFREGDTIKWQVPNGEVSFQVEKILFQPEAAGDYTL